MSVAAQAFDPSTRVLIVDDEDHICDLVAEALEDAGLEAVCVQNDRNAYAALAIRTDYAALVVDINLGAGTTGYDVARLARRSRPDLPVVYISGQSTPAAYTTHGVERSLFVQKPFLPRELAVQVCDLLSKAEVGTD